MKKSSIWEKLMATVVNVLFIALLSSPLLFVDIDLLTKNLIVIGFFLFYNLTVLSLNNNRGLGMLIMNLYWGKNFRLKNMLIYSFFYTLSLSSIFFWIIFPFDLLLINLLVIQLPTCLLKGTTFHGYLSGNMTSKSSKNGKK